MEDRLPVHVDPPLLPADYGSLDPELKRRARVAAVARVQCRPGCKAERCAACADAYLASYNWFAEHYLERTEHPTNVLPDGYFYRKRRETPRLHDEVIRDIGMYEANILAAPRSSAKSTVAGTVLPLKLALSQPHTRVLLILMTSLLCRKRLRQIARQLEKNPKILADYGPQKPKRGDAIWSTECVQLENGSEITAIPVGGRKHGERPDIIIMDDPEIDTDDPTSGLRNAEEIANRLENMVFNTLYPMLDEGSKIVWIGTLLTRKAYIWRAISDKDDERWTWWNRRKHAIVREDGSLIWEAKWNAKRIEELKRKFGPSGFAAGCMNNPTTTDTNLFALDAAKHGYTVVGDGVHPSVDRDPLSSRTIIRHMVMMPQGDEGETVLEAVHQTAASLIEPMERILTVDLARSISKRADFSAIVVSGFDHRGVQWILDLWTGKCGDDELIRHIFELGSRWRCWLVGVESASIQQAFLERMRNTDFAHLSRKYNWVPRIEGTKYHAGESKGDRIASMEWRFNSGYIKLPWDFRGPRDPWNTWPQMWIQIEGATRDLANLQWDDIVDAMSQQAYLPSRKGRGREPHRSRESMTPEARLLEGELVDPDTGLQWVLAIGAGKLTDEMLDKAKEMRESEFEEDKANWMDGS